jgi:hypothetical protein
MQIAGRARGFYRRPRPAQIVAYYVYALKTMKKDKSKASDGEDCDAPGARSGSAEIASVKPKIGEGPDHVKSRSEYFSTRRGAKKK